MYGLKLTKKDRVIHLLNPGDKKKSMSRCGSSPTYLKKNIKLVTCKNCLRLHNNFDMKKEDKRIEKIVNRMNAEWTNLNYYPRKFGGT